MCDSLYILTVYASLALFSSSLQAIGGGDMPVSIAFLNSLSGFSTSAAGFMMINKALVVAGAFVGISGIILTLVMCNAMNRSVANVLMGGFGDDGSGVANGGGDAAKTEEGTVTTISAEDVVELLTSAKSVIVVPGYGMAVYVIIPLFLFSKNRAYFILTVTISVLLFKMLGPRLNTRLPN